MLKLPTRPIATLPTLYLSAQQLTQMGERKRKASTPNHPTYYVQSPGQSVGASFGNTHQVPKSFPTHRLILGPPPPSPTRLVDIAVQASHLNNLRCSLQDVQCKQDRAYPLLPFKRQLIPLPRTDCTHLIASIQPSRKSPVHPSIHPYSPPATLSNASIGQALY